eukprot:722594-Hanusia_phi.AAC.1
MVRLELLRAYESRSSFEVEVKRVHHRDKEAEQQPAPVAGQAVEEFHTALKFAVKVLEARTARRAMFCWRELTIYMLSALCDKNTKMSVILMHRTLLSWQFACRIRRTMKSRSDQLRKRITRNRVYQVMVQWNVKFSGSDQDQSNSHNAVQSQRLDDTKGKEKQIEVVFSQHDEEGDSLMKDVFDVNATTFQSLSKKYKRKSKICTNLSFRAWELRTKARVVHSFWSLRCTAIQMCLCTAERLKKPVSSLIHIIFHQWRIHYQQPKFLDQLSHRFQAQQKRQTASYAFDIWRITIFVSSKVETSTRTIEFCEMPAETRQSRDLCQHIVYYQQLDLLRAVFMARKRLKQKSSTFNSWRSSAIIERNLQRDLNNSKQKNIQPKRCCLILWKAITWIQNKKRKYKQTLLKTTKNAILSSNLQHWNQKVKA